MKIIDYLRCELYLSVHLKLKVHLGTVRPSLLPVFDMASLCSLLGIKYSNSAYSWGNLVLHLTFGSSRQRRRHRKGLLDETLCLWLMQEELESEEMLRRTWSVRSGVCHVCESLTLAYEKWTRLR